MNPVVFALRRPVTVVVVLVAVLIASALAVRRMPVDIFPELDTPAIYVVQPYGGMDAAQMEGYLTNYTEFLFLLISGIHHVESKNIQGTAVIKLSFHPGTNMAQALAETVNYVNRSRAWQPTGTVPPIILRYDAGSVPVGYLVFSSKTKDVGQIQDEATFRVRPMLSSLKGVSAPPSFGGEARTIVIDVDPERLRAQGVSPDDVIASLTQGNVISPSGNVRVGDETPVVPINSVVTDVQDLGRIPLRTGGGPPVHLRDVGTIRDGTDVPVGYALVNGRRSVFLPITKRPDASTLHVVNAVKENLPRMRSAVSEDIDVRFDFDQSPYVTRATADVVKEGLLGAALTGLMVLLFLRDWRSVLIVVLNIPLAVLAAVVALWLTGQTINMMTLGGLALSVGILVDEATVAIENIHAHLHHADSLPWAVRDGTLETAVPRLLAMLCVLAVFIPSFFMEGAVRGLFVPVSLAVGFAMAASYLLSSTFVPVMCARFLRPDRMREPPPDGLFARTERGYRALLARGLRLRRLTLPGYLVAAVSIAVGITGGLGREIFPPADVGQIQLRLRAPAGTPLDVTETLTKEVLDEIGREAGEGNIDTSIALVGTASNNFPINFIYMWTAGSHEALMRVSLRHGSGVRVAELKERLRRRLPAALRERHPGVGDMQFSFEAADIVAEVMSFGAPTPLEIAVSGPNFEATRSHAEKIRGELARVPSLRDLHTVQALDYPSLNVEVDREKAGMAGVTVRDVSRSLLAATSSSRYVVPNFWSDPKSGIGYQVQIVIPPAQMRSAQDIGQVPVGTAPGSPVMLRDVAAVREGAIAGQYDRYNMRRFVSLRADVEGEDLGRVADAVTLAIAAAGEPPRGVAIDVRGQTPPMVEMFRGLAVGLGMTVVVVLLFLVAYFQSARLALAVVSVVPAVVAGSAAALWLTGTTLNVQSFMGAIMAVGVALANSILLISFADRLRAGGADARAAALDGAAGRLRPILMTSFAMVAGMLPMAFAVGEGGEQTAALARSVIGGLVAATATTLLIVPTAFAALQPAGGTRPVSLDPADPSSLNYSPRAGAPTH